MKTFSRLAWASVQLFTLQLLAYFALTVLLVPITGEPLHNLGQEIHIAK